jgi:hypothetical protein
MKTFSVFTRIASAAFLIGTEEGDLACGIVLTYFELHFYISANEERSSKVSIRLLLGRNGGM